MTIRTGKPRIRASAARVSPPIKLADGFYLTPEWRAARALAIILSGGICARCKQPLQGRTYVDHKVEIKDGGDRLAQSNLEAMHGRCHTLKTIERRNERMRG